MKRDLLPAKGNWYKVNLHCHTTLSDGHLTPEEIKEAYLAHGYSAVAYTDHDLFLDHSDLTDEHFVALNGLEYEIRGPKEPLDKACHFCAVALDPETRFQPLWHREKYVTIGAAGTHKNEVRFDESLPDYERVYSHEGISDMMQKAREAGFFVTYNHPVWSQEDARDYLGYNGMHAMEICNFSCFRQGYPEYNGAIYDEMLREGKRIFCVGADDNHNVHPLDSPQCDSFGAFVMVNAEKLEYRALTAALLRGDFYASQGPEIYEMAVEDGVLRVASSPAVMISVRFGRRKARSVRAAEGEKITSAEFEIVPEAKYLRVSVRDEKGNFADSQAYFLDEISG